MILMYCKLTFQRMHFLFRLCTGLAWDKDGDTLAIIQDRSGRKKY